MLRLFVSVFTLSLSFWSLAVDKTLVFCSEGNPSSFGPAVATDGTTFAASANQVYDRLLNYSNGGKKLIPGLSAEMPKVSKDQKTYTFKLRKGVKFHSVVNKLAVKENGKAKIMKMTYKPTRDFNADDVIFTFNRQAYKDHSYNRVGGGNYEYFFAMFGDMLPKKGQSKASGLHIDKIDDYTIAFHLPKPNSTFISMIAMEFMSIYSKEYADYLAKYKAKELIDVVPVGTGPFIFKRFRKDDQIRYVRNDAFYNGPAKIKNLIFKIQTNPATRFQGVAAGECDIMAYPAPNDVKDIIKGNKKVKGIKVVSRPGNNMSYLAMNMKKDVFKEKNVRLAVAHALNRSSYIDKIYEGLGTVAKNPLPPTNWAYKKDTVDYEYSPEKAKEYMKKAGYSSEKPLKVSLWALPVSRPYLPNGRKMAELMKSDLDKVGFAIEIKTYDWPTYLAKSKAGEHDFVQLGWTGDNSDPDNFFSNLLTCEAAASGSNRAFWCDQEFQKEIDAAKLTADQAKRTAHYHKAQEIYKKSAPSITLAHSVDARVLRENIVNYEVSPYGNEQLYFVDKL